MTFLAKAGTWLGKNALSLLGLGTGVGQSAIDAKIQRENVDKTIAANKQMAEYAYSKNLEMWNRQNLYNSPAQQMQRFKEAGLNPVMMYGKGTGAAGQATTLPQYQAPRQEYNYRSPVNIATSMQTWMDMKQRSAQLDMIRERERLVAEQANIKEKEARSANRYYYNRSWKMLWDKDTAQQRSTWYETQQQYNLDAKQEAIRQTRLRNQLLDKDIEYYFMNKLAGPLLNTVRYIPGIGNLFKRSSKSISAPRRIQTYPDRFYQNWK